MVKTRVIGENEIKNNILLDLDCFKNSISGNTVVYDSDFSSKHDYLNYINSAGVDFIDATTKRILVKEMWELESFGPGMGGDMMRIIAKYFDNNNLIFFKDELDIDTFCNNLIEENFHNKVLNFRNFIVQINSVTSAPFN